MRLLPDGSPEVVPASSFRLDAGLAIQALGFDLDAGTEPVATFNNTPVPDFAWFYDPTLDEDVGSVNVTRDGKELGAVAIAGGGLLTAAYIATRRLWVPLGLLCRQPPLADHASHERVVLGDLLELPGAVALTSKRAQPAISTIRPVAPVSVVERVM